MGLEPGGAIPGLTGAVLELYGFVRIEKSGLVGKNLHGTKIFEVCRSILDHVPTLSKDSAKMCSMSITERGEGCKDRPPSVTTLHFKSS